MAERRFSRRRFLRGAGAALAAPYVITSSALGGPERAPASERIVMGTIGCGGRGTHDMTALMGNDDVQMIAICDVIGKKREAAKAAVDKRYGNTDCVVYRDLRELLARDDIDAVLVATGDNWHTTAAILAAKAGKDMYCEKPMSVTVTEGRALCQVMERYGTIFQCGTQRRSVPRFKYAVDLAQSGKLGELKTLYAEKAPPEWFKYHPFATLPPETEPPKEEVDWDMWLGPAAWRPYNKEYLTRRFWMCNFDFSGGTITEWGSHTVDLCQWANGADGETPVEFDLAEGTVVARYANGVKLVFEEGKWPLHVRFVGTEGMIYVDDDGNMEAEPKSLLEGRQFGKGYPNENHVRNFLDCVKSRKTPIAPAEGAHRANATSQIANICQRVGRKVRFDPKKEQFIDDPIADRMLARTIREPWRQV
ncbi:MAG TPA: Gfo/Idh/MocA family oxidoreductase [Thermoguttaceae bacterium]|nr:Gfo/Idh/MocA family oxidoreductase [Thermoguttaceae bacterium]